MKGKKALKRLNRAEALLSSVLLGYAKTHPQIRGLVNSAKASVRSAKEAIGHPSASAATKPVVAKAENNRRQGRMGPSRTPAAGAARRRKRAAKRATGPKALANKAVSRNQRRISQKRRAPNPKRGESTKVEKPVAARSISSPSSSGSLATDITSAAPAKPDSTVAEARESHD